MKISATIVIYNESIQTLEKNLNCFMNIPLEKELIVIDNSSDKTLKKSVEKFDNVKYIHSGNNIGFSAGHNLGFKHLSIKSDIHMVINPDVSFNANEMTKMLEWFYVQKEVSLAVPKVLYSNGKTQYTCRNIPSIFSLMKRRFNIKGIFDAEVQKDELERTLPNTITEVPFCHGCFMMFKTDVFQKINGFDERFFMYMEDIDIFIKAKSCGKTVLNPNYQIFHEHRKGSSKSVKLFVWHTISAIKFFWKYK